MRSILAFGACAAALAAVSAAGAAQAATEVEIKHAVARVTVIPENRGDVKVEFISTNPALPMQVSTQGNKVVVDGDLRRRIRSCGSSRWNRSEGDGQAADENNRTVEVRGVGRVAWRDLPQIVVRTPMAVDLETSGAVFGSIGRSGSLELGNAGCGDWVIGNVAGEAEIDIAGSGDTRMGAVRKLNLRIAGAGDVRARNVAGAAEVSIAGSGDVRLASISGRLDIDIAGSGDVRVESGTSDMVDVNIAGSGDVTFNGVARNLDVDIAGSGDVRVDRVTGNISRSILGSGSVWANGQELRSRRRGEEG